MKWKQMALTILVSSRHHNMGKGLLLKNGKRRQHPYRHRCLYRGTATMLGHLASEGTKQDALNLCRCRIVDNDFG